MRHQNMEAHLPMTCPAYYAGCRSRTIQRATPTMGARLITLVLVLAALLVMSYGARWQLEQSPAAANELTMATCILDAIYGDAGPANICTTVGPGNDKEKAL
ncbi:MAG: hypothetical protein ABJC33_02560 [Betaproteobacteria bacterium]